MSKNINVNPGQYKVRGRDRMGQQAIPERERAVASVAEHRSREEPNRKKQHKGARRARHR